MMLKRILFVLAAALALVLGWRGMSGGSGVMAGDMAAAQPAATSPDPTARNDDDPFAELLKNNPSEVVKTGPSCRFIKIQLPPGVSPEDIPGF